MIKPVIFFIVLSICSFYRVICSQEPGACKDNTLDRQQFTDFVASVKEWLLVAKISLNSVDSLRKPKFRARIKSDQTVNVELIGYSSELEECMLFSDKGLTFRESAVLRDDNDCCCSGDDCLDTFVILEAPNLASERFISQDLESYVWWFVCEDGTVDSIDSCNVGYFELLVPETRCNGDLKMFDKLQDLSSLIRSDKDRFTNITKNIKENVWNGPVSECNFE